MAGDGTRSVPTTLPGHRRASAPATRGARRVGRGDHARAAEEAEAEARRADLNSGNLYDLACVSSRASAAAARDPNPSPADRARLGARNADRAMHLLRQAAARGWNHPRVLRKDPDLDPLRGRGDFRKLAADLEAKTEE